MKKNIKSITTIWKKKQKKQRNYKSKNNMNWIKEEFYLENKMKQIEKSVKMKEDKKE